MKLMTGLADQRCTNPCERPTWQPFLWTQDRFSTRPVSYTYLWREVAMHDSATVNVFETFGDIARKTNTHRPRQLAQLVGYQLLQGASAHKLPSSPFSSSPSTIQPFLVYGHPMEGPLYFCPVISIFFLFFLTSSNLSGRRLDVYHTSTHGVALVRI